MKDKVFLGGIALITISFIACMVSFYLLLFGLPVFLIGVILVSTSKQSIKIKILTTLLPIVLYVPFTYLFLFVYNYSLPKTILIPSNHEGALRIIYEENCGNKYEEIDGKKTMTFPKNGILILNEDFDSHINYKYYLLDEYGGKKEIHEGLYFKDGMEKIPYVMVAGSGTIGQSIEANSKDKKQKSIKFSDLYVYNKDKTNRNEFVYQQKLDSLTIQLVNRCRKKN